MQRRCTLACPAFGGLHAGEDIIVAAKKVQQQAAGEDEGRRHIRWAPVLPAAQSAMLAVLVHIEGIDAAGRLLLEDYEEQHGQEPAPVRPKSAAAGRKGKTASSSSSSHRGSSSGPAKDSTTAAPRALLTVPAINGFLSAAVAVATMYQVEGSDDDAESAAQSAVQVAVQLFKQQVVAISTGSGQGAGVAEHSGSVVPDGATWGCLAQLYVVLGQRQQVSNIVVAAVKQQLPGVAGDTVQIVLAGAAAAFNAAGQHVTAVQLLDGLVAADVRAVTYPGLAKQLLEAVDGSSEAEQVRPRL